MHKYTSAITTLGSLALLLALTLAPVPAAAHSSGGGGGAGKASFSDLHLIAQQTNDLHETLELHLKAAPDAPQAMLLPAIQKVREAAARSASACEQRDGSVEPLCATNTLAQIVLESGAPKRGQGPTLLSLYADGAHNGHIKKATITCRKAGEQNAAPQEGEDLMVGILIGLLKQLKSQSDTPKEALDLLNRAIETAEGLVQ